MLMLMLITLIWRKFHKQEEDEKMTKPVKIVRAPVTDEYGGVFPEAVAVIFQGEVSHQTSFGTDDVHGSYSFTGNGYNLITYRVSYWYDEAKYQQRARTRPLIQEINGVDTQVFTVDLSQPEISVYIGVEGDQEQQIINIIESDLMRRLK